MSDFSGDGFTPGILTREFCDASAQRSEYAANEIILPNGGTFYLCQHHTDTNARAFPDGTTVLPLPDVYGSDDTTEAQNDAPPSDGTDTRAYLGRQ